MLCFNWMVRLYKRVIYLQLQGDLLSGGRSRLIREHLWTVTVGKLTITGSLRRFHRRSSRYIIVETMIRNKGDLFSSNLSKLRGDTAASRAGSRDRVRVEVLVSTQTHPIHAPWLAEANCHSVLQWRMITSTAKPAIIPPALNPLFQPSLPVPSFPWVLSLLQEGRLCRRYPCHSGSLV